MSAKHTWLLTAMIFILVFSLTAVRTGTGYAASFVPNDARGRVDSRFGNGSIITPNNTESEAAGLAFNMDTAVVACGTPITVSAEADSWIDQNSASNNFAADGSLKVQSKDGGNFRALVRFPLPVVPDSCVVESAALHLHAASATLGRTLEVLRLAEAWAEETVTWNNQPEPIGPAAVAASDLQRRRWDVTSQVQVAYETGAHHGFLIRDAAENGLGDGQQFISREQSEDGPELLIRFVSAVPRDPAAPDSTLISTPVELSLENSATFNFTGSDDVDLPYGSAVPKWELLR